MVYLATARRVILLPPEEKSYLATARLATTRREELSGYRQTGYHQKRRVIWLPPEEMSYLAATRRVIWLPPKELSSYHQKRWVIWRPPEELSGYRQKRWVIWRPPEGLSGGCQKSYEGQSKINECFLVSPKPLNVTKTFTVVMKLQVIKTVNGISAIEWGSGGSTLVLPLSFGWLNCWVSRQIDFMCWKVFLNTSVDLLPFTRKLEMFSDFEKKNKNAPLMSHIEWALH